MTKQIDPNILAQFTGSETCYKHSLVPDVHYTDGVKYVADAGSAYWIIDEIAISQLRSCISREEFQVWTLTVHPDKHAELVCTDGNEHVVFRHDVDWTDFPLDEVKFFVANDVIMLPNEY